MTIKFLDFSIVRYYVTSKSIITFLFSIENFQRFNDRMFFFQRLNRVMNLLEDTKIIIIYQLSPNFPIKRRHIWQWQMSPSKDISFYMDEKSMKMFICKHACIKHNILVAWFKQTSRVHTFSRWVQKAHI